METNDSARKGLLARWHDTPLYLRILGALVLGVIAGLLLWKFGTLLPTTLLPASPEFVPRLLAALALASKLVLRLLGALAPVLILLAIVNALLTAHFERGTAGRLIRLLILNTLVAITVGLLVANTLKPGRWAQLKPPTSEDTQKKGKPDVLAQFLDNIPKSVLGPLGDEGKVIGVIFIAVAFGIALRRHAKKPLATIGDFVELGLKTLITILHWIIDLVPLAVFGLVASIIGSGGFGAFHALGMFIVAVIVALLLQAAYYLTRIRFGSWVRPAYLLRNTRDALVMAFSTSSSTVTMPVTFECLHKRVGLREKSASLGALVGANFNNDGTALYEAMAALFISQMLAAQGLGLELTLAQQLMVVLTSVVASVGAAGIPEAGLVTMTLVFSAVGLPIEYIALLLPVDWFLDRCRTCINVMGDMNVACLIDGRTREAVG